jgi:hypothetical protein
MNQPIPHLSSPLQGEEQRGWHIAFLPRFKERATAFLLPFKGRAGVGMGLEQVYIPRITQLPITPPRFLRRHHNTRTSFRIRIRLMMAQIDA